MIHLMRIKSDQGGIYMAKKVTEKKPLFGNNRSHALNSTRRKQNLNFYFLVF